MQEPGTSEKPGGNPGPERRLEEKIRTGEKTLSHKPNDLLIFDLDGTLIDSKEDLVNSVNAMLSWKGRGPLPHDVIASYVGSGAPMVTGLSGVSAPMVAVTVASVGP